MKEYHVSFLRRKFLDLNRGVLNYQFSKRQIKVPKSPLKFLVLPDFLGIMKEKDRLIITFVVIMLTYVNVP